MLYVSRTPECLFTVNGYYELQSGRIYCDKKKCPATCLQDELKLFMHTNVKSDLACRGFGAP